MLDCFNCSSFHNLDAEKVETIICKFEELYNSITGVNLQKSSRRLQRDYMHKQVTAKAAFVVVLCYPNCMEIQKD